MQPMAELPLFLQPRARTFPAFAAWNRFLLTAAASAILCAASLLAFQAAGPHAQEMIAGEGMLIDGGR